MTRRIRSRSSLKSLLRSFDARMKHQLQTAIAALFALAAAGSTGSALAQQPQHPPTLEGVLAQVWADSVRDSVTIAMGLAAGRFAITAARYLPNAGAVLLLVSARGKPAATGRVIAQRAGRVFRLSGWPTEDVQEWARALTLPRADTSALRRFGADLATSLSPILDTAVVDSLKIERGKTDAGKAVVFWIRWFDSLPGSSERSSTHLPAAITVTLSDNGAVTGIHTHILRACIDLIMCPPEVP